ncbi:MAG: DUF4824 family protein [Desulfobulbus sp.]
MKKPLVGQLLFAAAFVLLAAVNALILSRVADNQTPDPLARLWLTERELPMVKWLALENSGAALRINWRNLGRAENSVDDRTPSWLSGKKLEELGFVFANGLPLGDHRAKPSLDLEVFVVLEYSGPAYHEAVRRAERALARVEEEQRANPSDTSGQSRRFQAKKRIRAEQMEQSRLFVVNAGKNAAQLRTLYKDPARYIITSGIVGIHYREENGRLWAQGMIRGLRPAKLHLPLEQRRQVDRLLERNHLNRSEGNLPRYEVEVVYGKRDQPWIGSIRSTEAVRDEREKQ